LNFAFASRNIPVQENFGVYMTQPITLRSIHDLSQAIRERRKELGLTQADAAGLVGVGVRFLSELERGKPTLEVGKVLQVIHGFGFSLSMHQKLERIP
jgi:HTH-type transcriptional regulator/antitoxin HipB